MRLSKENEAFMLPIWGDEVDGVKVIKLPTMIELINKIEDEIMCLVKEGCEFSLVADYKDFIQQRLDVDISMFMNRIALRPVSTRIEGINGQEVVLGVTATIHQTINNTRLLYVVGK